jgi:hypothetical protein
MPQRRRTWKEIPEINTEKYKDRWLLGYPGAVGRSHKWMSVLVARRPVHSRKCKKGLEELL